MDNIEFPDTHPNLRVLYAEDDADARFMVTTLLGFSDIDVMSAATFADAWSLALNGFYDAYLLDSQFSDGSGLDLCRGLRGYDELTPIIFYSGRAYEADKQQARVAGADEYLTKPFMGDLAEAIRLTVARRKNSTANDTGVRPSVPVMPIRKAIHFSNPMRAKAA